MPKNETIIELDQLKTVISKNKQSEFTILNDITYKIKKGRILGIVGESGCGKSMLANSIINLLPKNIKIKTGKINFHNRDQIIELQKLAQYGKEFRKLRADKLAMIFRIRLHLSIRSIPLGSKLLKL